MSTITRDTDLLVWLAEQLKLAEPQVPVVKGIILAFDELIIKLEESGRFDPVSRDWSYYMLDVLEGINHDPVQRTCSGKIFQFVTEIYQASGVTYEVSCEQAIKILLTMLGLDESFVQRKRIAGSLRIISTSLFEQTYGFKVRVRLPVGTTHCGLSKNRGDYFTI